MIQTYIDTQSSGIAKPKSFYALSTQFLDQTGCQSLQHWLGNSSNLGKSDMWRSNTGVHQRYGVPCRDPPSQNAACVLSVHAGLHPALPSPASTGAAPPSPYAAAPSLPAQPVIKLN